MFFTSTANTINHRLYSTLPHFGGEHNKPIQEVEIIFELFREKVRHAKVDKKYTNADIAKLVGIKTSTIHAFMSGARTSEKTAKAIAAALNIEM